VLYDKGNDLENSGKYEEAIKSYNRILELTPDYVGMVPRRPNSIILKNT